MTAKSTLTGSSFSIDFGDFGGSGSFGGIKFRSIAPRPEPTNLFMGDFALTSIFAEEDDLRNEETSNALHQRKAA